MLGATAVQGRYVTARQVAETLGVSLDTVRRWLKTGRLRGFMPGGTRGGYRIRESEVERFIKELEEGGRDARDN